MIVRTNMFTLWNEIHSDNKMGSFDLVWKLGEDLIKLDIQSQGCNRVLLLLRKMF